MKKIIMMSLITLGCAQLTFAAPMNLSVLKQELVQYHNTDQYERGIAQQIQKAKIYLANRIRDNQESAHPQKLAMVLDIDETSLSNYRNMLITHFGGTEATIRKLEKKGDDSAIKPTLELFNYARKHHVAVFFITGRPTYLEKITIENLHNVGYSGWQGIYFKPDNYDKSSAIPYKTKRRKEITDMGYDIVLNVGDQYSDLDGGYADKALKLPDPFYLVR